MDATLIISEDVAPLVRNLLRSEDTNMHMKDLCNFSTNKDSRLLPGWLSTRFCLGHVLLELLVGLNACRPCGQSSNPHLLLVREASEPLHSQRRSQIFAPLQLTRQKNGKTRIFLALNACNLEHKETRESFGIT